MKLLGFQVPFTKAAVGAVDGSALMPARGQGLFGFVRESFTGAWQRNIVLDNRDSILSTAPVYSCVARISTDIAKLRMRLVELKEGIWTEVERDSPFWPVLRKPNAYQNRIQFILSWLLSKLLYGNTYVLKDRDMRGIVTALHVLDPRRVQPLITRDGDVYYQLGTDDLMGVTAEQKTVPASEIIHDRGVTLFHPLVGVSPIYACGLAASQRNRIQNNSALFFENMSRPSGILTAPGTISDVTALRLKDSWEKNFQMGGLGRTAVLGDGITYEPMTITAVDSQLIEQLKWTGEDIASAFMMPAYKIGVGPIPTSNNVEALNRQYYDGCLQRYIEDIELCMDEGLRLPDGMGTEFDLDGLLRMDSSTMADALGKLVAAGLMAPNEGRARLNLPDVPGGNSPFMQQQNWSLEQLARRDIIADKPSVAAPPVVVAPPPPPAPEAPPSKNVELLLDGFAEQRKTVDALLSSIAALAAKPQPDVMPALATILERQHERFESFAKNIQLAATVESAMDLEDLAGQVSRAFDAEPVCV